MAGFLRRAAVAAALLVGFPVVAMSEPALFVARDADTTIYLFGTIHYVPCDPVNAATGGRPLCADWMTDPVAAALAEADELWLETVDDPGDEEILALTQQYGMLEDGQILTDLLPEDELLAILDIVAGPLGELLLPGLLPMQPWLVQTAVADGLMVNAGASPVEGVDFTLERHATERGIPVLGFETAEVGMRLLSRDPLPLQVADLRTFGLLAEHGVDPVAVIGWTFDLMWEFWTEGDLDSLLFLTLADEEVFFERFGDDLTGTLGISVAEAAEIQDAIGALYAGVVDLGQRMIDDYEAYIAVRNRSWMAAIGDMLDRPGTFFVAVGAGHLTGDAALQTLVEAEGAEIKRVQ